MPDVTPNLGLKKPLGNEVVSRAAYNENLDILDQNAAKASDLAAHLAETIQQGVHGVATTSSISLVVAPDGNDFNSGTATTLTGTVTVTAGSTTVTGNGTSFLSQVAIGDYIVVNNETRKVVSVSSDTQLSIDKDFINASSNIVAYVCKQPLKTLQAALNKLPRILLHKCYIYLAQGTYNERISICAFIGGAINSRDFLLYIYGGASLSDSVNYIFTNFWNISGNNCRILINGLKFTGTSMANAVSGFVNIEATQGVTIRYCQFTGAEVSFDIEAGLQAQYSKVRVFECDISNFVGSSVGRGLVSIDVSEICSYNNTGSGNTVALYVDGGIIRKCGTQPTGSTNEQSVNGGQIV